MKKRALSLLLVFAMILSFVPTTALAAASTEVTTEEALRTAVAAGGTVTLGSNIELNGKLDITKSVILNLGGYTISRNFSNGSKDAGYAPAIHINASDGEPINVTIENGTVKATGDSGIPTGIYVVAGARAVTLSDVIITADSTNETKKNQAWGLGIAHPCDKTITQVTVDKTCSISGNGAVVVTDNSDKTQAEGMHWVELDVGCDVVTTGTYAAISGHGTDRSNPQITIRGKVDASKAPTEAIYLPQTATTVVESGATITGLAGIAMKSGEITIESGAEVNGTGEFIADDKCSTNNNGVNADGSAIFIESYDPPYDGNMKITIEGGAKLTSTNSYAIRENPASPPEGSAWQGDTAINSITIKAGAVLNSSQVVGTPIQLRQVKEGENTDRIHIEGGTYSHRVKYEYLTETDETKSVLWEAGTGPYTYYATVDDARAAKETKVTERIAEEKENDVFITLNYNDGGDETTNFVVAYRKAVGEGFNFPKDPESTQEGTIFAGWKEVGTTTTDLYKNGGKLDKVTTNREFTATWSELGATVVFSNLPENVTLVENGTTNLINPVSSDEGKTTTYTVADKTKEVTFNLKNETTKDIEVAYQVGTGSLHTLSVNADKAYVLPASAFSTGIKSFKIVVTQVAKKKVTFNVGQTGVTAAKTDTASNLGDISNNQCTVEDKTQPAKFKLTLPSGVTDKKYTVTYKIGETGTEETLEPAEGVYTLPANLAGDVTVTVTAADKNTITLDIEPDVAKTYVASIVPATTNGNLTPKDETATEPKVYVATDDTKPISFVVTENTSSEGNEVPAIPENHHIVVKYKLATDANSAYKTLTAQSETAATDTTPRTYTYTLAAKDITGDIIVTAFVEATPVYTAEPSISGSTTTTTITETEVIANIEAAKDQKEPLTIEAKVGTESTTVTKSEVELAGNLIQTITSTETNVDLAVTTDVGTVELPSETVSKIVDDNKLTENDPLTVKVEDQKDQIETFTEVVANAISLFDVTLMSGDTPVVAENLSIKITLSFYIGTGLINPKLYRFEDGKGIELSDVRYDAKTGYISGKTDHLSQFYGAVAADASIASVLGQGVKTNGTGGIGEPEVFTVQVPSGEGQPATISSTNILTTDENATVTLYSDSAFTAEESSITLKDGPNVVYVKVENATDTNGSTAYYKITVDKAAASTDCTLETVLGEVVKTTGGAGTKESPYVVTVVSNAAKLKATDIVTTSTSATVKLYDSRFETEVTATDGSSLTNEQGARESAYATVTNGGTTVYYEIVATGAAITPLDVTLSDDGTKVNVDPSTVTAGATRKYAIVTDNPEFTIASWNTATTQKNATDALALLNNNQTVNFGNSAVLENGNGKYIVVADVKGTGDSATIVAAGSMKIQLPVTVTINDAGLAEGDTLTVRRGTNPVTGGTVPYGTSLNLELSNANYVVYAGDDVVPMNGINGTYTVTGDTTFSVEPGYSVTITNDSNAALTVEYDPYGGGNITLYKGVSMVPQKTPADPTQLNITLNGNYILMVNGARVELDEDDNTASVPVTKDTTIEVVPGYTVTITPGGSSAPQVQVMVDGKAITGGELFPKDTELTIIFVDATGNYKVQVDGHTLPFSTSNATISYTVTANTEIKVALSSDPDKVEELTVMVDPTTGTPSVTKDGEPVTDGVVYAVVGGTKPPAFTGWMNDKTQDEALTDLNATVINPPLTPANNNQYLVALQISGGNVIAAGCSDSIKVSSPTTPTTGYTVSGTVNKGNTNLETVAGILVTLKGANGTKTTTVKADGTYEFVGVEAGTYGVEIALNAASKYDAAKEDVTVGTENVTVPTITLALVDSSTASALWGDLKLESEVIGTSDRATFKVTNMKAGMYYCITITKGDSVPSDQFFQADKDFWSFVTDKDSTIFVIEFVDEVKFAADGNVDPTNSATRTKTYTAE